MAKKNKTKDHLAPDNEVLAEAIMEESEIEELADVGEALPEDEFSEDDADKKIHNLERGSFKISG